MRNFEILGLFPTDVKNGFARSSFQRPEREREAFQNLRKIKNGPKNAFSDETRST